MKHTMRSAFKRWLILHDEVFRTRGYIRVPNWFRWHIRSNYQWEYTVLNKYKNYYKQNPANKRGYKGFYEFYIKDEDLIKLERPEYIE